MRPKPPFPPKPTAEQRIELDALAARMLEEATCFLVDGVYSATGGARENISIVHQQIRCMNLAWALGQIGKVKTGDVVAVIGGSFSGMSLAVELAVARGAIVYVFEKGDKLLSRFRNKAHRYLSPVLNSRALGRRFDPAWSLAHAKVPVFAWTADWATEVVAQWAAAFRRYAADLPIFVFLGQEIATDAIARQGDKLHVRLPSPDTSDPIIVDVVIDATGFGEETNPKALVDYSYWDSGHRLIYENLPDNATVVISGCGDSGVIEALHYAVQDFRHDEVKALWPQFTDLDLVIDQNLADARFEHILKSQEVDRYDEEVLSEICWWLDTWDRFAQAGRSAWWRAVGAHDRPIFTAIDTALRPHLRRHFPCRRLDSLTWDERETFVLKLPLSVQMQVRADAGRVIDDRISLAMAKMARRLPAKATMLKPHMRPGLSVILNGVTPTPYTRQLSPYNVWAMRLLLTLPCVSYRQGRIDTIARQPDGHLEVRFLQGPAILADRAVTRYGMDVQRKTHTHGALRDERRGDWLLTEPYYDAPKPGDPQIHFRHYPARDQVTQALVRRQARHPKTNSPAIHKALYVMRLLMGARFFPPEHPYAADPQARLAQWVRARTAVLYTD